MLLRFISGWSLGGRRSRCFLFLELVFWRSEVEARKCRWTGARDDDLTERMCPVPDWRVRALGLLGVSASEVSSDEPDGLCGSSCTIISAEPQLFLAFRDFLGLNIIGDRLKGWICVWNTEGGGVNAFSSAGICRAKLPRFTLGGATVSSSWKSGTALNIRWSVMFSADVCLVLIP